MIIREFLLQEVNVLYKKIRISFKDESNKDRIKKQKRKEDNAANVDLLGCIKFFMINNLLSLLEMSNREPEKQVVSMVFNYSALTIASQF